MILQDIKDDIDFLCGSTSATYLNADKIRNINTAYNDVARIIWESAGGWQYDDKNNTDFGIATTTLVDNQQDYSLPTTAQRIERVEIKDSTGNWIKLDQIDQSDIKTAMSEYLETAGLPVHYDIIGNSVMLYPTPSSAHVTLVGGLQVWFDRSVTEFAVTASSASVPGFATPFHRILSYAAALDFTQEESNRRFLILQKDRLEKGLRNFYGKRNTERTTRIRPASQGAWRQYT